MIRDASLFEHIMIELYGVRWHTLAGEALGVHRATVSRWAEAEFPIPENIWDKVQHLMELKIDTLQNGAEEWERRKLT